MLALPLAAVVAVVALYAGTAGGNGEGEAAPALPTRTVEVTRRNLIQTEEVDGVLDYGDATTVRGAEQGTVTWLPAEGSTVRRGEPLFEVDNVPARLLYGDRPMFRRLAAGDEGPDVRQLEENLRALGCDPDKEMAVDEEFDWATAAAVQAWQEAHGAEEDGVVEPGEVVFLPGEVRVGAHRAAVGSPAQTDLMEVTPTRRVVTVDLEVARQSQVQQDDRVEIELPSGTTTPGQVSSVGKVAQAPPLAQGETDTQEEASTIEVEVTLDRPEDAGTLDQAPVGVSIVTDSRQNVLAVPVNALVALAEGGYAVEVEAGGQRSLVPVDPGLFAGDYVEVKGDATGRISEGTRVVVPA